MKSLKQIEEQASRLKKVISDKLFYDAYDKDRRDWLTKLHQKVTAIEARYVTNIVHLPENRAIFEAYAQRRTGWVKKDQEFAKMLGVDNAACRPYPREVYMV